MENYRKIWEEVNGPIPKDEQGRSYDIHHIDGNRSNNHISNLKAVSLQEHLDIHLRQGEYDAANLIAKRMELDLYSGYKRPLHSKTMLGENNPMFGKRGESNPNFGKKRPSHSEWMKKHGGKYIRSEKQKNELRHKSLNRVVCKDSLGNILLISKEEFNLRTDLVGVSKGLKQPKLNKKIKCIEDNKIFESIKDASLYYGIGSSNIIANIKKGKLIGQKKLGHTINFIYL